MTNSAEIDEIDLLVDRARIAQEKFEKMDRRNSLI